jgi:hypothetical protein
MGDHIDGTGTNLTVGQFLESFLCDVEARTGGVDSGQVDRRTRSRVGQAPAPAAVGRVEDDVKGAADEGDVGTLPKVGNRDASPLTPLEHATLFIEPARSSNVVSKVTRALMVGGGTGDAVGVDDGSHECAGEPEAGA